MGLMEEGAMVLPEEVVVVVMEVVAAIMAVVVDQKGIVLKLDLNLNHNGSEWLAPSQINL
jgi:hypothetical protein